MLQVVTVFCCLLLCDFFFFSSRRRHTRLTCDWSSDVCSSDLFSAVHYWRRTKGIAFAILFWFTVRGWMVPVGKDRKSTRLNSSHMSISYAVFCLKKKKKKYTT